MSKNNALIPVEQRSIDFYNDKVTVVQSEDGTIYVPVRPICELLGVSWPRQSRKLKSDPVLSEVQASVAIRQQVSDQRGQITTEMLALPLDFLNGWLFGINPNRVKDEIRETVIRYQMECYRVLADAFVRNESFVQADKTTNDTASQLVAIREMGLAIVRMAEQQIELEANVTTNTNRLDKAAQVVGELGRRVANIEQKLSPAQAISDEQAADISQKVKAIAQALSQKDSSKNHYQAIFGEIYRQFRVPSYKAVRQEQYQAVLNFLDSWIGDLE